MFAQRLAATQPLPPRAVGIPEHRRDHELDVLGSSRRRSHPGLARSMHRAQRSACSRGPAALLLRRPKRGAGAGAGGGRARPRSAGRGGGRCLLRRALFDGCGRVGVAASVGGRHRPALRSAPRAAASGSRGQLPPRPGQRVQLGEVLGLKFGLAVIEAAGYSTTGSARAGSTPSSAATAGQSSASRLTRRRDQPSSAPIASATGRTESASRSCPRGEDPQAGASQEHIGDAARLLKAGGDRRLGKQVGAPGDDRRGQPRLPAGEVEDGAGGVPVAEGELAREASSPTPAGASGPRGGPASRAGSLPYGRGHRVPHARPDDRRSALPSAARS